MAVKLLTEHHLEFLSLKGCLLGLSESTLVKILQCWESHVTANSVTISKGAVREGEKAISWS